MSNAVNLQHLHKRIGAEAFGILTEEFPGKSIYIPKNHDEKHPDKKIRNENIRSDYYDGLEVPDLMVKYNLSKSRIHKIIENNHI